MFQNIVAATTYKQEMSTCVGHDDCGFTLLDTPHVHVHIKIVHGVM